jgi:hypothetical protein
MMRQPIVRGVYAAVLAMMASLFVEARAADSLRQSEGMSLVGTWRLVEYANRLDPKGRFSEEGTWTFPYGEKPAGYFVYDPTGHFTIHIMRMPSPKPFASGDDQTPTINELKNVYEGYVAYFGTYSIDATEHSLIHHIEGSLQPGNIGKDQTRPFELVDDRLIIGDQQTWRRVLERVR